MATNEEKKMAIKAMKTALKKDWGKEVFRSTSMEPIASISTGSVKLDESIGIGGLPKGRVIEVFGAESCGKTTLCSLVCAEAQKDPDALVGFVDVEHAYNPPYAQQLGVDTSESRFYFSQPSSAEEALDLVLKMTETAAFSVIVLDSIGGLMTKAQLEKGIDDNTMAEVARVLGKILMKIVVAAAKTDTIILFVNQQRSSMNMYGPSEVTMGGKALPYFCSVRLKMRKTGVIMDGDTPVGQNVEIKIIKNKVGPPFGVLETDLYFGKGFDQQAELVESAINKGIIVRGGAWYYVNKDTEDQVKFQGKNNVIQYYRDTPEEYEKLLGLLMTPAVVEVAVDAVEGEDGYEE